MKHVKLAGFDSALFAHNIPTAEHVQIGTSKLFQDLPKLQRQKC